MMTVRRQGWTHLAQRIIELLTSCQRPHLYLAMAMALKLLYPSDTALEMAVLSAHSPRL